MKSFIVIILTFLNKTQFSRLRRNQLCSDGLLNMRFLVSSITKRSMLRLFAVAQPVFTILFYGEANGPGIAEEDELEVKSKTAESENRTMGMGHTWVLFDNERICVCHRRTVDLSSGRISTRNTLCLQMRKYFIIHPNRHWTLAYCHLLTRFQFVFERPVVYDWAIRLKLSCLEWLECVFRDYAFGVLFIWVKSALNPFQSQIMKVNITLVDEFNVKID